MSSFRHLSYMTCKNLNQVKKTGPNNSVYDIWYIWFSFFQLFEKLEKRVMGDVMLQFTDLVVMKW